MSIKNLGKPVVGGGLASVAMLAAYFAILSLVSGWSFALSQFSEFWPYIIALTAGFGAQIGLYFYLKQLSAEQRSECKHRLKSAIPRPGRAHAGSSGRGRELGLSEAG